jgi:F-type H+-transporting ATPase subunit c
MSRLYVLLLVCLVLGMSAPAALAEPPQGQPEQKSADNAETKSPAGSMLGLGIIGVCFGAGACAIGGGLAIAKVGSSCIEAIARQPEAAGSMFAPMIVTAAMIEGGMLFAIVVCLVGVGKL